MHGSTFSPGPTPNTVRAPNGSILTAPEGWILLPPGGAALTRRVKEAGDHWVVAEKKGRKVFSRGVWAPAATVERIRAELETERSTESFAKRKEADARRREKAQAEYVEDFLGAVVRVGELPLQKVARYSSDTEIISYVAHFAVESGQKVEVIIPQAVLDQVDKK
jgi:hypothetical protein